MSIVSKQMEKGVWYRGITANKAFSAKNVSGTVTIQSKVGDVVTSIGTFTADGIKQHDQICGDVRWTGDDVSPPIIVTVTYDA